MQAAHAAIESARHFISPDLEHPSVVILGVKDEKCLQKALDRLQKTEIRYRAFREPDIGNQLTAIASEPVSGEARRHFRQYQLLTDRHLRSALGGAA